MKETAAIGKKQPISSNKQADTKTPLKSLEREAILTQLWMCVGIWIRLRIRQRLSYVLSTLGLRGTIRLQSRLI